APALPAQSSPGGGSGGGRRGPLRLVSGPAALLTPCRSRCIWKGEGAPQPQRTARRGRHASSGLPPGRCAAGGGARSGAPLKGPETTPGEEGCPNASLRILLLTVPEGGRADAHGQRARERQGEVPRLSRGGRAPDGDLLLEDVAEELTGETTARGHTP